MATLIERKLQLGQEEQWKTVKEFQDYEVSTFGRVRKWFKNYYRYPVIAPARNGSLKVTFIDERKTNSRMLGKLVYETFLEMESNEDLIYLDGDKTNCALTNLATVEELVECYNEKQASILNSHDI